MAANGLVIAPPVALLLGAALVAWGCWAEPAAEDAVPPAPPSVAARREAPRAASPGVAPSAPASVASPAPLAIVDLTPLLTAPEAELRTALLKALAARDQGGRLYARALARRCADLAGLRHAEHPDTNDARHQRAVARQSALAAGCGQLTTAEWLAGVNVGADEQGAVDPLLAIQQSDLDDAALLQAVFAGPEPQLLEELGERLLARRLGGQPTLYFDGQHFDDDTSRATAQAALRLLPCQFGLACDERDPEVWLACLRGDGCTSSREASAPPGAPALAARLAAALRARELERFLPPS